ncbi:MAG: triacylglycerol lipase [Ruminococcus sp.]|nr:triacylglycerol lipase [Ruminococcus sp.]
MKKAFIVSDILIVTLLACCMVYFCDTPWGTAVKVLLTVGLFIAYICTLFRRGQQAPAPRLRRIQRGADLILTGGWSAVISLIALILWIIKSGAAVGFKIGGAVIAVAVIGFLIFVGIIKVVSGAKQIKIKDYILMMMFWWFPIVNIFLIRRFYQTARREYIIEADKMELDNARAESEICRTKYPVLLVHGIFFRDWQLVNYWGRIPAALIKNGADIYYGKQQSSLAVADSAAELKNTILSVIEKTGAEKVNIIAHSKGGLDSRYAISCLGMDKYVATLTTINTPHEGCDMVDFLLEKVPDGLKKFIEKKYNTIFHKLGDTAPDFMAGVNDLSAINRKEQNKSMPDSPDVSYRSVMTIMNGAGSAGFPLNLGYMLINKLNGPNDGLVWEESAKHGDFRLIKPKHKRGISHGDVIDLMRENIDGYDVREFFVDIVRELKEQGY